MCGDGGASADYFNSIVLQPMAHPICATDPRFCIRAPVLLYLREHAFSFSGDDFTIADANSGAVYFVCAGQFMSFTQSKIILDNAGVPVVNIQHEWFSFTHKYNIFHGAEPVHQICQIESDMSFMGSGASMYTTFVDAVSRQMQYICLQGDWFSKRCIIYSGDPMQGGVPIAKIYRPYTGRTFLTKADEYYLEVAPGVDLAFMVVMCIAMDEHAHDHRH